MLHTELSCMPGHSQKSHSLRVIFLFIINSNGSIGLLHVATYNNAYMIQCLNYVKLALQYLADNHYSVVYLIY